MRATRLLQLFACLLLFACLAFSQVGNSTITGTVTDQAGAAVAGATVEAKNAATGVVYRGVTTSSGDYTIPDLPVGTYAVNIALKGFKTYSHPNLGVQAAQVTREDINLQVGNQTESVTVVDQASLLKTESADIASNVTLKDLDDLPMLGIGTANSGSTGVRNPYNVLQLLPGVTGFVVGQSYGFSVNGQSNETMVIEGQDATSRLFGTFVYEQMAQPSADSIQEMAVQTSNYAAEYGQASSAVLNMTMKSGTNQYHGSGYDYWVNEDLNAGAPFSVSGGPAGGNGSKLDPRARRNDFGGTLGGPIYIPKVYNGHDKTFFFWNYEEFLETQGYAPTATVPVPAYLNGDFSAISPNGTCNLCGVAGVSTNPLGCLPGAAVPSCAGQVLDPLNRQQFANTVYDPTTRVLNASGIGTATPFLNNIIPSTHFDPVAVKIQALFPAAQTANLNNNYTRITAGNRYSAIPSLKLDHNLSAKDKLSFYYSEINTESQISEPFGSVDGLPAEIGEYRGTFIPSYTYRLNYDRTIKPNLLLHLGVGYLYTSFADHAPFLNFNPSQFGLNGFLINRQFPTINGLCQAPFFVDGCLSTGGMQGVGTFLQIQTQNYEEKPSYSANATYIRGKHTIKVGTDFYFEGQLEGSFAGVTMNTGTAPTSEPFLSAANTFGYTTGFGYGSFLLGDYTGTTQTPQLNYREGYGQYAVYAQDSWKVTRKLTLDYGVRWDLMTPEKEQYGRLGQLSTTLPNANAGGRPGSTIYASTCGCSFYQSAYPYGIGPRVGVAYQIDPKTVFRAGWGIVYSIVNNAAGGIVSSAGVPAVTGINGYINDQAPGFIQQPVWPVTNNNIYPLTGTVPSTASAPFVPDRNENRPPRINQFSAGFEREITRNFVVEASYVGNRGAWLQGGALGYLSQISASQYASYGLYPYAGTAPAGETSAQYAASYHPSGVNCVGGNDCDRALLALTLTNPAVMAKLAGAGVGNGGLLVPYGGSNPFPTSSVTLGNALVPYPQFGALGVTGSPTGDNKYDSLQIKATKRLSHGLTAGGTFTWAQGFTENMARQDFFNPQSTVNVLNTTIPPRVLQFNFTYTVPKAEFLDKAKFVNQIIKDWQVGGYATYESAPFLAIPASPTANFLPSLEQPVPGQSFYSVSNINDIHNINPLSQVILNPNAWQVCSANTTCGDNQTIKDFRGFRHPQENANFGRNFRIKERMNLYIRAEFVNIFNRTGLPQPSTSSPQSPVGHTGTALSSGFGVANVYQAPGSDAIFAPGAAGVLSPRTGTLIARFTF